MMDSIAASSRSATGRIARAAVLGLTALIVVLLLAGPSLTAWHDYLDAIDDAGVSTANLATILDEHAQRTLRLVEVTVEGLADTLDSEIAAGPPDLDHVTQILRMLVPAPADGGA